MLGPQAQALGAGGQTGAWQRLGRQKVDARRAQKARHEAVDRPLINLQRCAHLLDATLVEDGNAVAQGHGLHLVVGHIDDGGPQLLVQTRQLQPGLVAQGGIQIGQGFVEEKDLGLAHDGPADGHALALAARELARLTRQQALQLQAARSLVHRRLNLGPRPAGHAQRKTHVLGHAHVRVERIALEDHGYTALGRWQRGDLAAADKDLACAHRFQAGQHAQRRALAAARGAHQHHELAVAHLEVQGTHHGYPAFAIGLGHAAKQQSSHLSARPGRHQRQQ